MRWLIVIVCIGGLVTLGLGVLVLGDGPTEEHFGGDIEAHGLDTIVSQGPNYARLFIPGGEQDLGEVRRYAFRTCAAQSVETLSAALGTRATPEAVARRYAEKTPLPRMQAAIYESCLEGFSD